MKVRLIRDWISDDEIVIHCPIPHCRKWIEVDNWFIHLTERHRRETLAEYFPDVDLIFHLAGKMDEYGRRPEPTEYSETALQVLIGKERIEQAIYEGSS
jgi:hypothetical protein